MSSEARRAASVRSPVPAPGAVLLCRAVPEAVVQVAELLREPMVLVGAGDGWSVLVPEGTPWTRDDEPVSHVLIGWASALAVAAPWPVLALWWEPRRSGWVLGAGFHRPVGYAWHADGTPDGDESAMRVLSVRLGLDPVLDMESLVPLTRPEPDADAGARLRGLLAVLTRVRVSLPAGLVPGAPAAALCAAVRDRADAHLIDWPTPSPMSARSPQSPQSPLTAQTRPSARSRRPSPQEPSPQEPSGPPASGPTSPAHRAALWLPHSGTIRARALSAAQLTAGLPVTAWGLRHRSPGWTTAGALLLAHGALGLVYGFQQGRG